MDNSVYQSAVPTPAPDIQPPTNSSPLDKLKSFAPKTPPKLLYIFGGVAVILLTLALAGSILSRNRQSSPTLTNSTSETIKTDGFITYLNAPHFYKLSLPPKWSVVETTPDQSGALVIQTDAQAVMTISSFPAPTGTLDEYLDSLTDGRTSTKTNSVRVGAYDGYERFESWTKTTLQPVITYIQIQDKIYVFSLLPSNGKNAISSESLLRDYRSALSTFELTSTTGLGQEWKPYDTSRVDGLDYPPIHFTHPQSWAVKESVDKGNLTISIYRNNYEISIAQAAVGGAVCLFKDSPSFQGSSGDLRTKEYTEFNTTVGGIMRRYFNKNEGEKSTFYFCQQQDTSSYFETPTQLGGIVYYVPAKYDSAIIKEMDDIVITFEPITASASATTQ